MIDDAPHRLQRRVKKKSLSLSLSLMREEEDMTDR